MRFIFPVFGGLGKSDVTPRNVGPSWCHCGPMGPALALAFTLLNSGLRPENLQSKRQNSMNEINELRGSRNFHEIIDPSAILDGNWDGEIEFIRFLILKSSRFYDPRWRPLALLFNFEQSGSSDPQSWMK